MSDAQYSRAAGQLRKAALGAIPTGAIRQLADGRGSVMIGSNASVLNQLTSFSAQDQYAVTKKPGIVLLDGGPAYWSYSNAWATYAPGSDRDFYLGRICADTLSADTACTIDFNAAPPPLFGLDLATRPFTSALIGTQALGGLEIKRRGSAHSFVLSSVNEAQKLDALSDEGFNLTARPIVEMGIKVVAGGAAANCKVNFGIASGTHATNADSIAQRLLCHLNSNDTAIYVESGDGTHSQAAIASGQTYTAGTRFEVWFDLRVPAAAVIYVNGVAVLGGTTFNVSSGASLWYLLAHVVKASSTDTLEVQLDWLRVRYAQQ